MVLEPNKAGSFIAPRTPYLTLGLSDFLFYFFYTTYLERPQVAIRTSYDRTNWTAIQSSISHLYTPSTHLLQIVRRMERENRVATHVFRLRARRFTRCRGP
jgi:hypothetical protein